MSHFEVNTWACHKSVTILFAFVLGAFSVAQVALNLMIFLLSFLHYWNDSDMPQCPVGSNYTSIGVIELFTAQD